MATNFGERPNADASIPSPQSEAVANELQELSLQPAPNMPPVRDRTNVLQLKLQQRRSREELVNQGIMPPLKSSAAFNEQRRSLERARTEDYLKRKIKSRPERSELIRMHILEETSAEPSLQAKQLQLKRARLADDLNDKISHRPGPMELIHKNILPVHSSIKKAFIETQLPKASGDNSSCDEDSSYSLSPELPGSQESPLGLVSLPSPPETLPGSCMPSPGQVPPPAPPLPPVSGSSPSFKLTNETTALSAQRIGGTTQLKCQPKPNSVQRHKKPKDNKPKIKKLKYHQYIPPDQKGDKEPPPHLDSSYAKILQQQQLFLQLQILNQQQQHYNYHTILPAPPKPQTDQQPSSTSSVSMTTSFPHRPAAATASSNPAGHNCPSSAPVNGTKPASLPANLDEMKVAELKSELKLRGLPVSGTKTDLIERLRSYQELNGGGDTTSSPTAGGTAGPGAEGAGQRYNSNTNTTNNNNNNSTSQQPFQFHGHQTSSSANTAGAQNSGSPAEVTPQHLLICDGVVSPHSAPLTPSDCSPGAMSPEDGSFSSDPLGEMMSPPLTQLSLHPCSAAQLAPNIKEEQSCSTPAPCQLPPKPAPLQKHCTFSLATPPPTTTAPLVALDKDRMLQEKDKQIEELTRMLRQKQRLVEVLRTQLERGKRGGRVSEPLVLLKVKQEPPDKPSNPLSFAHPPYPSPPSSVSCEIDVAKVTVKEEAMEAGEVRSETAMQLTDAHGLPQPSTQTQEEIRLQIKSPQMSKQSLQQKQQHVHPPQISLQLAQQQAIQKLLLQQQHNHHNQQQTNLSRSQPLESQQNLQKLSQQRKKKSHRQQLKLHQQQHLLQSQHQQQSKQHQQQMRLKQQILLKQQKSFQLQQNKQQQQNKHMQQIQIQTKIQLKQQQVLVQQKPQVSLNQQSSSAPSLPVDLGKSDSTPTLVTDGNGNHFLITLTNHLTENQRTSAPGNKASNPITLQRLQSTPAKLPGHSPALLPEADNETKQSVQQHKTKPHSGLQLSVDRPEQDAAQCLSAPPTLQPFFRDQQTDPSGKNTSPPPPQAEICPSLDALFSPLSPASIKTAASSPDHKDTEHEEDFIDIILQTGDMSSTFKPAPDPSLDHLSPSSPASLTPPSPVQLLLSPPAPPSSQALQTLTSKAEEEKQGPVDAGTGRLEDFLESTTGKPLLGVEPGVLLTLIDDLHSQMLCTPSILDRPLSPMDTFELGTGRGRGLDAMDWLDFTSRAEDAPTMAPLGPQSPPSVFSTDFLDGSDLQIHWDSCL